MSRQTEPVQRALAGLLLTGAFVNQPEVWPGFVAFVERNTGKQWAARPETMTVALHLVEHLRKELEGAA